MGGGAAKVRDFETDAIQAQIRSGRSASAPVLTLAEQEEELARRQKEHDNAVAEAQRRNHFIPLNPDLGKSPIDPSEWHPGDELRIFCGTWNMEGKGAPEDISLLIQRDEHHIYAVASQECLRTIPKSFLKSEKGPWETQVLDALGGSYQMVSSCTLVATHVAVFARHDVRHHICESSVESAKVTTGLLGGSLGNKGGVGVGFVLGPVDSAHSISFLFLSAHFAAHQNSIAERNNDYEVIVRDMKLGKRGKSSNRVLDPSPQMPAGPAEGRPVSLNGNALVGTKRDVTNEYDLSFFMGDFNYRVDGTRGAVEAMLKGDPVARSALLSNDQLTRERKGDRVFRGFNEGQIAFLPTYKFTENTDEYETKKMRIPSWTDRILYKQHDAMLARPVQPKPFTMSPLEYNSVQDLRFSDHRPVKAAFSLTTPRPTATSHPARVHDTQESSTCCVM